MTTNKLILRTCIITVAMLCLFADRVAAQVDTPTGVITSGSGFQRPLLSLDRVLDRVGLGPNQTVTVTLQFTNDMTGKPISVGALDGGLLTADAGMGALVVGDHGFVSFRFQAGAAPGLYRLIVQLGTTDFQMEFYVLDAVNPQKNPPRLQIVN